MISRISGAELTIWGIGAAPTLASADKGFNCLPFNQVQIPYAKSAQ
jgi:hypothetical protein